MCVEVTGQHFEPDTARYVLAIMKETLIPSLQAQHDRNFTIFHRPCAMDHRYTLRMEALRSVECEGYVPAEVAEQTIEEPFILITVPDDVCLVSGFTRAVREVAEKFHELHREFTADFVIPDGVLLDGDLFRAADHEQSGIVVRVCHPSPRSGHATIEWTKSLIWMRPKHQLSLFPPESIGQQIPEFVLWKHIHAGMLRRYCAARICTGTAGGSRTEWHRSKSFVFARTRGRRTR